MHALLTQPLWAQLLIGVPLGLTLLVSAVTDWRERKVYNWLTYPMFLVGLVLHTIVAGWSGLGGGLLAALVAIGLGIPLMVFGWLGGGDSKLLAVVGAFLGLRGLGEVFFYSVLAGSVLGMLMALFNGYLWTMLKRMGRFLRGLVRTAIYGTTNMSEKLERDERSHMPFAVAIFVGGALAWVDAFHGWPGLLDIFLDAYRLR